MPAKTIPAAASKPPAAESATAATRLGDRVSLGLLSLVVGSIGLSLNAVPVLRFLAVLLSLAGITLAVLEFRSPVKDRRQFGRAIAGTIICGLILVLTAIRPFWPARAAEIARAPAAS